MHQKLMLKLKISLEGQLIGRGYFRALKAMNIAKTYHTGKRKDDTPEFQHQVEICLFILTLPDLIDIEECIVVAFMHDLIEDYGITIEDVADGQDFRFGIATANRVFGISKVYKDKKRNIEDVWENMPYCPIISIVKGADRVHNHGTMAGGFKMEKIPVYLDETEKDILPMLKLARKRFPEQSRAYYLIETILHRDIHMLRQLMTRLQSQ